MSVQCYNKGCLAKFDPENNEDGTCVHHPGAPVFHEGYKSWSCCGKKTTDFTEFLNMKGCTKGKHNPEKAPEPEKPPASSKNDNNDEVVVSLGARPPTSAARCEDPLTKLNVVTTPSLKQALERAAKQQTTDGGEENSETNNGVIAIGTACFNNGCMKTYQGEASLVETCYYHAGQPIFHEGMKYWSCCERKTSDFDAFMQQAGCIKGKHVWTKEKPSGKVSTDCRYDFHQTGPDVYLTLYAKNAQPLDSYFEANSTNLNIHLEFNLGKNVCDLNLSLWGAIDLSQSVVTMYGTKVELRMRKAEPFSWPRYVVQRNSNPAGGGK